MKAYIEYWHKVYEPAEGGYWVSVSNIEFWRSFGSSQECLEEIQKQGYEVDCVFRNTYHKVLSEQKCYDDGEQYYDYYNVIMEAHLPYLDADVVLIEDWMPDPAPTTYDGYR